MKNKLKKCPKYMIFIKTKEIYGGSPSCIPFNDELFDELELAQRKIKEICLRTKYSIEDFRIFQEYPTEPSSRGMDLKEEEQ